MPSIVRSVLPALAVTVALGAGPAMAQSFPCGDRDKLIAALKQKYDEQPVAVGISTDNTEAFEVFASKKGTWSLVMTTSTGKTCIMAAGHSWTELARKLGDQPS